jgi:hypothetical protein
LALRGTRPPAPPRRSAGWRGGAAPVPTRPLAAGAGTRRTRRLAGALLLVLALAAATAAGIWLVSSRF